MLIGCVKEIKKQEYRVGLTPENVHVYCQNNHEVWIESGAGDGAGFSDEEYIKMGAKVVLSAQEIWKQAEMIIKVKEPLPEEYPLIQKDQILFTYLHLAADKPQLEALLSSECKAVAYETIRDKSGHLPLLKPMSEVAGRLSVQEGAKALEKPFGGRGLLLSGIPGVPKADVLIIGGGVVGTNACSIALGMGASVTVLDTSVDRLTELDTIFGSKIQTLFSQEETLKKALYKADLVIGAVLIPGKSAPKLVRKSFLPHMKNGAVIVDVAIDQGGCFETSKPTYHEDPTYIVDGVVHYCVANIPGAVPRTSTLGLTNATLKYGLAIAEHGLEAAISQDEGLKMGVNCYQGRLTSEEVAASFGIAHTPL